MNGAPLGPDATCPNGCKFTQIPKVSIARFINGTPEERAAEVENFRKAFTHNGVAMLTDTQVPQETIEACISESRKFFTEKTREEKQVWDSPQAEYPPRCFGRITSPKGMAWEIQSQTDDGTIINEWLMVRDWGKHTMEPDDPYYHTPEGKEFFTPMEKHPQQQKWPEDMPKLKEATVEYHHKVELLTESVYELFALALGEPKDAMKSKACHGPSWFVCIAHYPKQDKPPPEGTLRIQPHWDRGLFTLISSTDYQEQFNGSGLQILINSDTGGAADGRDTNTEWRNVILDGGPGSFVINVGDMMARWTNGVFKHVVHRVPNQTPEVAARTQQGRISVMCYVIPDYSTQLTAFPSCVPDQEKPKYEDTWVGECQNWGSALPIYDLKKQERMRAAQGLYLTSGQQTTLMEGQLPTDMLEINESQLQDIACK